MIKTRRKRNRFVVAFLLITKRTTGLPIESAKTDQEVRTLG
jgi:hypothetical protein